MTIDIISAILFPVQIRKTGKRIAGVLLTHSAAVMQVLYNLIENILRGFYGQGGFINALIHSLSRQETTSHSVAVWRELDNAVFSEI